MTDMETYAAPMPDDVAALAAEYDRARAAAKAADEHQKSIRSRLMLAAETALAGSGMGRVVFNGPSYEVRVVPVSTWRLDTTRIKAEQPEVYAAYARQSTSLKLDVVAVES